MLPTLTQPPRASLGSSDDLQAVAASPSRLTGCLNNLVYNEVQPQLITVTALFCVKDQNNLHSGCVASHATGVIPNNGVK